MDTYETKVEDIYTTDTNGDWDTMVQFDQGYLACGTQLRFDDE
jgi:hypothetical protein